MNKPENRNSLPTRLAWLFRIVRALPNRARRHALKMLSHLQLDRRLALDGYVDYRHDGYDIRVDLADFVGREMFKNGWYERPYVDFIRSRFGDRNGVFLDVGANVGNYSLALAAGFAETFAFEPNPDVFDVLESNCRRNPALRIRPCRYGLSSQRGNLHFYRNNAGNSGASGFEKELGGLCPLTLAVEKGDDLHLSDHPVSAIKIDVEGHELHVIRGLQATIARDRPVVFLEWLNEHMHAQGGISKLRALLPDDYRILCSTSRRAVTLQPLEPPYRPKYDLLFCVPALRSALSPEVAVHDSPAAAP